MRLLGALAVAALAAGCSPLCAGADRPCVEVGLEGSGQYSRLIVEWRSPSEKLPIAAVARGEVPGPITLPRSLRITQPPGMPGGELRELGVSLTPAEDPTAQLAGSVAVGSLAEGPAAVTVTLPLRFRHRVLKMAGELQQVEAADLDGDGRRDLALGINGTRDANDQGVSMYALELWRQEGDGSFRPWKQANPGAFVKSMTVTNLDRQGGPEIVMSTFANRILFFASDATPLRSPLGQVAALQVPALTSFAVLNLDNQDWLDLVAFSASTGPNLGQWTFNRLNGQYEQKSLLVNLGNRVGEMAAADLNGDAYDDLVMLYPGESGRGRQILMNIPAMSLLQPPGASPLQDLGAEPLSVRLTQLDNDARKCPDLVVSSVWNQTVATWLGSVGAAGACQGTFTKKATQYIGLQFLAPMNLAVADFDADGVTDIAVSEEGSPTFSVLLGNGDGTLRPPLRFSAPAPLRWLTAADLDGDGRPDLIGSLREWPAAVLFMNEPPADGG